MVVVKIPVVAGIDSGDDDMVRMRMVVVIMKKDDDDDVECVGRGCDGGTAATDNVGDNNDEDHADYEDNGLLVIVKLVMVMIMLTKIISTIVKKKNESYALAYCM